MNNLFVLAGPTASGKTSLSVELAKRVNGEIISADSMQVYRGMDIGTAKIKEEEKQGIPHFLIDEFEPDEEFNVTVFQKKAKQYIKEISDRGHLPMIVGGTGFYIQSVLYDIDFEKEEGNTEVRKKYEELASLKGKSYLHDLLKEKDMEYASEVSENNVKKVIRALEFYELTGKKLSEHNREQRTKESPYNFAYFVLTMNRDKLYKRIDARVDKMFEDGLVDEVTRLMDEGYDRNLVSMQGLGYKEVISALNNEITMEDARELIKKSTRHFAKRQLTWFRRERDVTWLDLENYRNLEEIVDFILEILRKRDFGLFKSDSMC
ncbi:MAG: tRNA (adenosine(37)-N6)-dimethylallyltransferase MiaA [Catonella sp.]|nr:tRNA (adenosine(37)-N6)-dimethylallyltransferase MiaA [Catonella sp.]MDY6357438.1 tRNA (adenosine(37)-N6)-dimethylallyltransferase MiaA [Catonella sp.]